MRHPKPDGAKECRCVICGKKFLSYWSRKALLCSPECWRARCRQIRPEYQRLKAERNAKFARWIQKEIASTKARPSWLAREVGVTQTAVRQWVLGYVEPPPPRLEAIKAAFAKARSEGVPPIERPRPGKKK